MSTGVWVFAETKGADIHEASPEIVSEGRRLADQLHEELSIVAIGCPVEPLRASLRSFRVERMFVMDDERLSRYVPEAFTDILAGLVRQHEPSILLFAGTPAGNDLAGRVAARVRTGLATNCESLQVSEGGQLIQTRRCFEGKASVTLRCPEARPQMATVVPGILKVRNEIGDRPPVEIVRVRSEEFHACDSERVRVKGFIRADPKTIDISEADLIVAGGGGVRDKERFESLWALADALEAAVAGSRVAVDNGYIGKERQIGQSGKTVAPELLVSCGISGANAHTIGMREAKTIVAINKDRNAPILDIADLGVVGDLNDIVPILTELIRKHRETAIASAD